MPQKNSPQIAVPKQLSVKHKDQKKREREKIKGDGIIPTQGGVLALHAQSPTYPTAEVTPLSSVVRMDAAQYAGSTQSFV